MKPLILVSDGDPSVVQTLSQIATALDLRLLAESPSKVVERANKDRPSLIVLDVQQRDGLELLSLLKTGLGTQDIPVVVVGEEDSSLKEMALEIGADAFVEKPLGSDFLPKVATFLDSQK